MKKLSTLVLASCVATRLLFAQDAAPQPASAESKPLDLIPDQPGQILPPPLDLPLIPEMPVPMERPRGSTLQQPKGNKKSATAAADDAVRLRIRLREVKTKARRDPAVQAQWEKSEAMKTDFEKREMLKVYYKLLFTRMARIDSTLKKETEISLQTALRRLDQNKIATAQSDGTQRR